MRTKKNKTIDYTTLSPVTPEIRRRVRRVEPGSTVPASRSVALAEPGVEIEAVAPGSPADDAGLRPGHIIRFINGEPIRDTIDFFFCSADSDLRIEVLSPEGEGRTVRAQKDFPEQHLGLELRQFTTQACGCNCVFCFVHQLPDNMRKSLYVKDEDYRLSFLQGSYMTGVTLRTPDLERIARQRLTPLYISVHAIDETLRKWLLGIRKALPILHLLDFFRENRIQVHTQIVLCPGHNDGAELERTLSALLDYHPTVQSVAIVPLGLTKWRDGLPDLEPVTPAYARRLIRDLTPRLRTIADQFGEPLVLLADEWYLIAGRRTPSYTKWPDLPQLENGVGMVYHFYRDFRPARRALRSHPIEKAWRVAAVTSTLSSPVLSRLIESCAEAGIEVTPLPTVNSVFGETIHVTGLLCGQDIERTIASNPGYDQYLLPGNCLRLYDERFLDDMTLGQLREATGARIDPVLGGSLDFVEVILEAATGYQRTPPGDHVFLAPHWANT